MKRSTLKVITAVGLSLAVISFSGCSLLFEILNGMINGYDETTQAYRDESWAYKKSNPVFEVDSNVKSVTITGLASGQEIYISKTNPNPPQSPLFGESEIPATHTQYVLETQNISKYTNATTKIAARSAEEIEAELAEAGIENNHYRAPSIFPQDLPPASRAVDTNPDYEYYVDQIQTVVDKTVKYIYVDADNTLSTYKLAKATLRAIGDNCYVWVVDGYFDEDKNAYGYYYQPQTDKYGNWTTPKQTSEKYTVSKGNYPDDPAKDGERVSREFVETVADKFDTMYPLIRNVFGEESNKLYNNASDSWMDMNLLSDTGTKVNIVVYDIGVDHSAGNTSGVLGYFYSKDYFQNGLHCDYGEETVAAYSNEGKYFYVDAYFSKSDPEEIYSTLGHEFQHMVNWGQKSVKNGNYNVTSQFNEMLSMICEDIIIGKLGLSADKGPYNRLPYFNGSYLWAGLEYRNGLEVLSYATNYAFGAFLIRQFGGVPLIKEMSTSKYVNNEAIVNAVNEVNGSYYTMDDLLCMYTQACIYRTNPSSYYTAPTLNQSSTYPYTDEDGISYNYPIRKIDLYDLNTLLATDAKNYYMKTQDGSNYPYAYCQYNGPFMYSAKEQGSIRPYGMMLTKVGTVNKSSSETVIQFGNISEVSLSEKLYIIVK